MSDMFDVLMLTKQNLDVVAEKAGMRRNDLHKRYKKELKANKVVFMGVLTPEARKVLNERMPMLMEAQGLTKQQIMDKLEVQMQEYTDRFVEAYQAQLAAAEPQPPSEDEILDTMEQDNKE